MNANARRGLSSVPVIAALLVSIAAGVGIGWGIATTTASSSGTPKTAYLSMVVEGHAGGILAIDNKTHDTMMPENLTVYVGQTVTLAVLNFDESPHTITNAALGIDFLIPGRTAVGVPSASHFTFTPTKAGVYYWYCRLPCDAGQGGWAMTPKGSLPTQPGFMGGWITVLAS